MVLNSWHALELLFQVEGSGRSGYSGAASVDLLNLVADGASFLICGEWPTFPPILT